MKLVEIQANQFNELAQAEPNKSFHQTSNWGNFYSRLDYAPYYLGYIDEAGVYAALGLFLVKNGSIFDKRDAICPFGFLINYYDTKLVQDFTNDIKKFLSKKGASNLIINPNVNYITSRGNNDLLINKLLNIGYTKTKNNVIFTNKIEEIVKVKNIEDICLKAYVVDEDTSKLFKANINYKYLFETMGSLVKFIVCELDSDKSLQNLNASIEEAKSFIEMNNEDYKYFTKIENKKKAIETKQQYIDLINKAVSENGSNPLLAVTCLVQFNDKITQLFIDDKKDYEVFKTLEILNQKTLQTISELGYESFDGYIKNETSSKTDLIGEFTYRIK